MKMWMSDISPKRFLIKLCYLYCMQSGTATWLLFLSCCIFSLHNQLEGSGPRRSASQKQQIIWWNFTRFVQSILIQFQILWFMQHLLKKKYLSQDAFLGVSVLPKPGGSPLDHRRKPPAISSGHRHFKRTGFKLLHCLGQKASSVPVMYILRCIWRTIQVPLCFQCGIWWCAVKSVHISADYPVQYWHWNMKTPRWNSKSKGVESKALEQAVIGLNSAMLRCFICASSFGPRGQGTSNKFMACILGRIWDSSVVKWDVACNFQVILDLEDI